MSLQRNSQEDGKGTRSPPMHFVIEESTQARPSTMSLSLDEDLSSGQVRKLKDDLEAVKRELRQYQSRSKKVLLQEKHSYKEKLLEQEDEFARQLNEVLSFSKKVCKKGRQYKEAMFAAKEEISRLKTQLEKALQDEKRRKIEYTALEAKLQEVTAQLELAQSEQKKTMERLLGMARMQVESMEKELATFMTTASKASSTDLSPVNGNDAGL